MDEVAQMEKLEMELIKRLQNTQAIQKEAYLDLEKALSQPSAMLNTNALKQNLNQSNISSTKWRETKWTLSIFIRQIER